MLSDTEYKLRIDIERFAEDVDPYEYRNEVVEEGETIQEAIERNAIQDELSDRLEWLQEIADSWEMLPDESAQARQLIAEIHALEAKCVG